MKTIGSQMNNISVDDLSERIKIISYTTRKNKRGDIIQDIPRIKFECFAKVYPYLGKMTEDKALELRNEIIYKVIVRYREDILPNDILIWREKTLQMRSPPMNIENRRIYLQMECYEVIGDG